jgi:hypothetical protein
VPRVSAPSGDVRVQIVLEISGPSEQVEALVAGRTRQADPGYPLTLCVKDPR